MPDIAHKIEGHWPKLHSLHAPEVECIVKIGRGS
jgi:hypothetical protein